MFMSAELKTMRNHQCDLLLQSVIQQVGCLVAALHI